MTLLSLCFPTGQVHLEIEHKGKTLDMTVSPVHATIVWHFQEKCMFKATYVHTQNKDRIIFYHNQAVFCCLNNFGLPFVM